MKLFFSMLAFATLLIAPAHAQTSGNQALVKARDLMKIMGIEKTLNGHMSDADNIQRSGAFLISKIAEANPGEESRIGDVLVEADRAILPEIIPGYVEYMAEVYAMNFTPQELDQLAVFYKTDSMQELLEKSAQTTEVPELSGDERDQSNAFLETPTGKKLQQKSPLIMKRINLYAADVVRKKQRDLLYAALREDLPKNDLKVPTPFAPDTFMDKTIHDNTMKANNIPMAAPRQTLPQQSIPQTPVPQQSLLQTPIPQTGILK